MAPYEGPIHDRVGGETEQDSYIERQSENEREKEKGRETEKESESERPPARVRLQGYWRGSVDAKAAGGVWGVLFFVRC